MTISRRINLFILMTVSLVLILFAVLPHHHHHHHVCFVESHCEGTSEHDATECDDAESHEHEGQDAAHDCTLHTSYLLPVVIGQVSKQEIQKILMQHILYVLETREDKPGEIAFFRQQYFWPAENSRTRLISTSLILRGPPSLA